jgi:hypothetical protein
LAEIFETPAWITRHAENFITLIQQNLGQVPSGKTGDAGNQCSHKLISPP